SENPRRSRLLWSHLEKVRSFRMNLISRIEPVFDLPDGVIIWERSKLVLVQGEDHLHQGPEALIEIGVGATGVGEDETTVLDVVAEVLLSDGIELGDFVSVEEDDGRLKEVCDGGDGGIDDLPGEEVFPVARDNGDEVANVVGVVVPVAPGPVAELVDQDRRAALGQEQYREAGGHDGLLRDASPEARQPVLGADQLFGPLAIPVVLAKEANPREPAGPLHPVEKIVLPLLAHREVLADGEVAREPVDGVLEMGTGS